MRKVVLVMLLASLQLQAQNLIQRTKWKFKTEGAIRSAPLIQNDRLYFANSAGMVYCLNKENGEQLWQFETGGAINGSPALDGSTLYVVNRKEQVFALNSNTGKLKWEKAMEPTLEAKIGGWKYFTSATVVSDNMVYIGSGNGNLYALNKENGNENWKYVVGKRIRATPLIDRNRLYQPANDGRVHVLNKNSGKLLWKFETDGAKPDMDNAFNQVACGIYDSPSLVDNTLIFGSRDGKTYAVDTQTHKEKWRFTYGPTWAMASTVHGNAVYIGWSTNNMVCAIDLQNGKEKWKHQNGGHVYTKPLIVDNSVYYGCSDGKLYKLNKETGEEISTYQVGGEIFSSPKINEGIIYFGSDDGYMYALEEAPKAHMVVFAPEPLNDIRARVLNTPITTYLVDKGFEQIDEQRLTTFIKDRIQDKDPSVIVFALPIIPENVIGVDVQKGLFRQYLDTGGKVIWTGSVPNEFALGENGYFKNDIETGPKMLEVEFSNPNEAGNYYCKPTRIGLNMGIPLWSKSSGSVIKLSDDIIPLSIDEFGNCTAWMKKFNPRSGSGFISNRSWAWNVEIDQADLEIIHRLAIYGLK